MTKRTFHNAILRHSNQFHENFLGYSINLGNGKDGYSDSYRGIMTKIIQDLESQRDLYDSLFIMRFDLMLGEGGAMRDRQSQKVMPLFCKEVSEYLNKTVKNPRNPLQAQLRNHKGAYVRWVREYSNNKGFHYHCYICFDAKKLAVIGKDSNEIDSLKSLLTHYWLKCCNGLEQSNKPYVHINSGRLTASYLVRNNSKDGGQSMFNKAVYHLSYLAKTRTKGYNKAYNKGLSTHSIKVRGC